MTEVPTGENGQPDLGAFLQQAQALQEQLSQARDGVAEQEIMGTAGNGLVTITATGGLDFRSLSIDPSLATDVSMIEDLVLAALRDVMTKVDELNKQAMGSIFS